MTCLLICNGKPLLIKENNQRAYSYLELRSRKPAGTTGKDPCPRAACVLRWCHGSQPKTSAAIPIPFEEGWKLVKVKNSQHTGSDGHNQAGNDPRSPRPPLWVVMSNCDFLLLSRRIPVYLGLPHGRRVHRPEALRGVARAARVCEDALPDCWLSCGAGLARHGRQKCRVCMCCLTRHGAGARWLLWQCQGG